MEDKDSNSCFRRSYLPDLDNKPVADKEKEQYPRRCLPPPCETWISDNIKLCFPISPSLSKGQMENGIRSRQPGKVILLHYVSPCHRWLLTSLHCIEGWSMLAWKGHKARCRRSRVSQWALLHPPAPSRAVSVLQQQSWVSVCLKSWESQCRSRWVVSC